MDTNSQQQQQDTSTARFAGHTPGRLEVRPSSNPKNGTDWRDIIALDTHPYPGTYVGEAMVHDAELFAAAPALLAERDQLAINYAWVDSARADWKAKAFELVAQVEQLRRVCAGAAGYLRALPVSHIPDPEWFVPLDAALAATAPKQ